VPCGTIPQVSANSAEAQANYRLLSNEAVDPDAIRAALRAPPRSGEGRKFSDEKP
jgi:hypothetical protein